jgi:Flp pilus assembly protein TadB
VSKERARRRAEREAAAEEERRRREEQAQRAESRAALVDGVAGPVRRTRMSVSRWYRRTYPPGDPIARRRRRQTIVLGAILVAVQVLTWWLTPSWALRLGVLGISVLLAPVLRTLLFDRR